MTTHTAVSPRASFTPAMPTRLASLALSAVLTLAMLGGIHTLASSDDSAAARVAQTSAPRA